MPFGQLKLGTGLAKRRVGGSLGPGIVTGVTVLGDISISITSPSAMSVPMQTNGSTLLIETSGSDVYSSLDLTKMTLSVIDLGHDVNGDQVAQTRTVNVACHLFGPYNEAVVYQPVTGQFYVKLDDYIFNQDASWKTTILSVNFASGWLGVESAAIFTAVTRSDSLAYFPFPIRDVTPPWRRVASGETCDFEVAVVHDYARDKSMVACVEGWVVDSASTVGTVYRQSSFARSASTPNDATLKGHPVPTYAISASCSGLVAGRAERRWRVKPWIGPPVESADYGTAWPTLNPCIGMPFCYDTNGSWAPLYGILSNEQATPPGGKTLIATDVAVPVDVTGLSLSIAGALASGKVYADVGTLAKAVQTVNNSGSAVTIADGSYQRTTIHNDIAGGVAVCSAISGSALGSNTGAYSWWQDMSSTATYPPGLCAFEIRSETGLTSDDVRFRGEHSDGSTLTLTSRKMPSRIRLRGLTLDSGGITTAANNTPMQGGESATTAKTEAAAITNELVDCRGIGTDSVSPSVPVLYQPGFRWDIRTHFNEPRGMILAPSAVTYNTGLHAIGSYYENSGTTLVGSEMTCMLGVKLKNVRMDDQTASNRPPQKGRIFFNVESYISITTVTAPTLTSCGAKYPGRGGEGWVNIHHYGDSVSSNFSLGFTADTKRYEIDNLIVYHLGSAWKSASSRTTTGRFNVGYNEVGVIRINKRIKVSYIATGSYNVKGDTMSDPETATSQGTAHPGTGVVAYYKGDIATNGGNGYQAIQDVPIGILISNTAYWVSTGVVATVYGFQPLRQGNGDFRDHVGCEGNVASETATGGTTPSATSWIGRFWQPSEKPNATWTNYYNDTATNDFTPKAGGELVSRVPAGKAVTPIDLVGTPLLNDGTDAAGPLQRVS